MAFTKPRVLSDGDNLDGFESGDDVVDAWVRRRAHSAAHQGTAITYVVFEDGNIAGLYSLSAHSVLREDVRGGWLKRNVPEQIPAILLGMLGVDTRSQGKGLGASLLGDAIRRSQLVAEQIGARALLVDPASEEVVSFYEKFGFRRLPGSTRLFLPLRQSHARQDLPSS